MVGQCSEKWVRAFGQGKSGLVVFVEVLSGEWLLDSIFWEHMGMTPLGLTAFPLGPSSNLGLSLLFLPEISIFLPFSCLVEEVLGLTTEICLISSTQLKRS